MSRHSVLIEGDGVAGRCCGHLLAQAGYSVSLARAERRLVPLIMLSEAAQHLIRDIFQRDDLFQDLPAIRKRIVAWGSDARELEHSAVVISEEVLLDRLGAVSGEDKTLSWKIRAGGPLPESAEEKRFGSRVATAVQVKSKRDDACWIESVEDGWLFLNSGWLLAAGAPVEKLLEQSRVVQKQISGLGSQIAEFPASPRMVLPLGADGWIACGGSAMSFDPLCGDGTAHAVREAILASAVIRAADGGESVDDLIAHYEARLTAGFQRHLLQCRDFYLSGGTTDWWKEHAEACVEGIEWCGRKMQGDFRFRLEGLELKRVKAV